MEVAGAVAGKAVLKVLLGGAKGAVEADKVAKQGVRRDLPFLKEELAEMQSFLMAVDEERNKHKILPTYVTKVRTLAYAVDDCIQDAIVHLEKPSRWQLASTMRERQRIAKEMKTLRSNIDEMGQRNKRYRIAEDPTSGSGTAVTATMSGNRARRAASSEKPEVNRMVQLINSEDNDLKVIAVWGTSGNLEQTSIVREAYENPAVEEKFPCRAWVRVTQPFNPIEFVQSLVRQFHGAVGVDALLEEDKTAQQLAQEFNQHVSENENAYLIVLNNLNTFEEWDRIKTCFPNNKKGSRIIVSTKKAEVAMLSVGYESAELKLKELAADQILYAFFSKKASQDGRVRGNSPVAYFQRCRTMVLSLEESYLVGRATEKSDILQLITTGDGKVISVWGTRGIGKTTLVRAVYHSQDLSERFQMRAYVKIIHPFILEELLRTLVIQLGARKAFLTIPLQELMEELVNILNTTRCLIVLDDVSSIEHANIIVRVFRYMRMNSSKIIVTTRAEFIAKHCSEETDSIYMLNPLKHEDARDLFNRKVFDKTIFSDRQYTQLVEQEEFILRKCSGLPVAIVTVAVFLANQPKTLLEWSKLNEHINDELEMNRELETIISSSLSKNFDGLPYPLKSCILYLPIFPEDYKVRRRRLMRRWTAEGYSREVHGNSAETSDTYFMDLISRGMIVPCQLSVDSRQGIDSCQVLDLVSEIAIPKSREENLVFRLEGGCSQSTQGTVHHLAVSSNWKGDQSELETIVDMSRLRSMTIFGMWRPFFSLDKMRLLRVLDLEDTSGLVDHHLEHIGKLLHLRYLSLRGCGDIYHLPDSLGNLTLLESLDVKGTKITKLPKTTTKLMNLQHVIAGHAGADDNDICESMSGSVPKPVRNKLGLITVFSAGFCAACCAPHLMKQKMDMDGDVNRRDVCTMCCCAMLPALARGRRSPGGVAVPGGIIKLKSLLTLGTVNVSGWRKTALEDIKVFTRLRKLGVAGINRRNGQELCSAIAQLTCLESLAVWSDGKHDLVRCLDDMTSPPEMLQSLKLYGRLGRLPDWIQGLENLVKLKLRGSRLCEDRAAMQVLGSLPNLAILILLENSFEDYEIRLNFQTMSFPSLLVLQLQTLDVVRTVDFEERATPKLELLRFGLSSNGDCRFYGLSSLPSLREVVLGNGGRDQEEMTEEVRRQLHCNPNCPVLKIGY